MGGLELLLPLLLLLPILLITFRTRRQQRAFADMQQRLAVGQDVMTTSGLYGRVVDVDGDAVVLEVADGVRLRWARPAIGRILTPETPAVGETDTTASDGTPGDRPEPGERPER
jgi:preprotein translocase subunit YajC